MIQFTRPSVDNLINNLPDVLKSSRQFVPWNPGRGQTKVPLNEAGRLGGDAGDPNCWRTFDDAIALIKQGRAFGMGVALPSQYDADKYRDFNLITGLVALDGDAKRSTTATPYNLPEHISGYVRRTQTYSEFSTSLKGLRALAFGTIPTDKQNITKHFGDGTELSLYRGGWVTLSGLPFAHSSPTIEHRQEALDQIVHELWPGLSGVPPTVAKRPGNVCARSAQSEETFVLDWTRSASEDRVRQFIRGINRNQKQQAHIEATWGLKRDWNHGATPDNSLYTKRVVDEALWLQRFFDWTLQDVVDLVITFCRKHELHWSFGRAKKQISDGQRRILTNRRPLLIDMFADDRPEFPQFVPPPPRTPTLTGKGGQIMQKTNESADKTLSGCRVNHLYEPSANQVADTLLGTFAVPNRRKVSGGFKHKSAARDAVLRAICKHPSWVKVMTIAVETGKSAEAVRKQLRRLGRSGVVDCDGKGRYRRHHQRRQRKLKPCSAKPIPKSGVTNNERKTLSRGELRRRGWPTALIDKILPDAGKDYTEKEIDLSCRNGPVVKTRCYWVSRIKESEGQPWFEIERAAILRANREEPN